MFVNKFHTTKFEMLVDCVLYFALAELPCREFVLLQPTHKFAQLTLYTRHSSSSSARPMYSVATLVSLPSLSLFMHLCCFSTNTVSVDICL